MCARTVKLAAGLILSIFCVSLSNDYAYAVPPSHVPPLFNLSSRIGKVIETYQGQTSSLVYLIQDLHCHPQTQTHIEKIIAYLKKYHGTQLKIVGIEGSIGAIDTRVVEKMSDVRRRERIIKKLVKEGYVSGAELYGIHHPQEVAVYGLEEEGLYKENFWKLYESLKYREEMSRVLGRIQRIIERGKTLLYPKEMKEIEKQEEGTFEDYIGYVDGKRKAYGVQGTYREIEKYMQLRKMKRKVNTGILHHEAREVIERVGRNLGKEEYAALRGKQGEEYYRTLALLVQAKGIGLEHEYPSLAKYCDYVRGKETVNEQKLMREIEALGYTIKQKLLRGRTDAARVMYCDRYMKVFEKYLENRVSAQEAEEWRANQEKFCKEIREVNRMLSWKDHYEKAEGSIEKADEVMGKFYGYAEKRNEILSENMLKRMQGRELKIKNYELKIVEANCIRPIDETVRAQNFVPVSDVEKKKHNPLSYSRYSANMTSPFDKGGGVGVMVVGGFHVQGIGAYLRSRGISYKVIVPEVEGTIDEGIYVRRLQEQADYFAKKRKTGLQNETTAKHTLQGTALALMSVFETGQYEEIVKREDQRLERVGIAERNRREFFEAIREIKIQGPGWKGIKKGIWIRLLGIGQTIGSNAYALYSILRGERTEGDSIGKWIAVLGAGILIVCTLGMILLVGERRTARGIISAGVMLMIVVAPIIWMIFPGIPLVLLQGVVIIGLGIGLAMIVYSVMELRAKKLLGGKNTCKVLSLAGVGSFFMLAVAVGLLSGAGWFALGVVVYVWGIALAQYFLLSVRTQQKMRRVLDGISQKAFWIDMCIASLALMGCIVFAMMGMWIGMGISGVCALLLIGTWIWFVAREDDRARQDKGKVGYVWGLVWWIMERMVEGLGILRITREAGRTSLDGRWALLAGVVVITGTILASMYIAWWISLVVGVIAIIMVIRGMWFGWDGAHVQHVNHLNAGKTKVAHVINDAICIGLIVAGIAVGVLSWVGAILIGAGILWLLFEWPVFFSRMTEGWLNAHPEFKVGYVWGGQWSLFSWMKEKIVQLWVFCYWWVQQKRAIRRIMSTPEGHRVELLGRYQSVVQNKIGELWAAEAQRSIQTCSHEQWQRIFDRLSQESRNGLIQHILSVSTQEPGEHGALTHLRFFVRVARALGIIVDATFGAIADHLKDIIMVIEGKEKVHVLPATEIITAMEALGKEECSDTEIPIRLIDTEEPITIGRWIPRKKGEKMCVIIYISRGMHRILERAQQILPAEIFSVLLHEIIDHEVGEVLDGGPLHHEEALTRPDSVLLRHNFLPLLDTLVARGEKFRDVTDDAIDTAIREKFTMYVTGVIERRNGSLRCYQKDARGRYLEGFCVDGMAVNDCTIVITYNRDGTRTDTFTKKDEVVRQEIYDTMGRWIRAINHETEVCREYDKEGNEKYITHFHKKKRADGTTQYRWRRVFQEHGRYWDYMYDYGTGKLETLEQYENDHKTLLLKIFAGKQVISTENGDTIKRTLFGDGRMHEEYLDEQGLCEKRIEYDDMMRKVRETTFRHEPARFWGYYTIPVSVEEIEYADKERPSEEVARKKEFRTFDEQRRPIEGRIYIGTEQKLLQRTWNENGYKDAVIEVEEERDDERGMQLYVGRRVEGAERERLLEDGREAGASDEGVRRRRPIRVNGDGDASIGLLKGPLKWQQFIARYIPLYYSSAVFREVMQACIPVVSDIEHSARAHGFARIHIVKPVVRKGAETGEDVLVWYSQHDGSVNITHKGLAIVNMLKHGMSEKKYREIVDEIMKHEALERDGLSHEEAVAQGSELFKKFLAVLPALEQLRDGTTKDERAIQHDIDEIRRALEVEDIRGVATDTEELLLRDYVAREGVEKVWEEGTNVYIMKEQGDGMRLVYRIHKKAEETRDEIVEAFHGGEREADDIRVEASPVVDIEMLQKIAGENRLVVGLAAVEKTRSVQAMSTLYTGTVEEIRTQMREYGLREEMYNEYDVRQLQMIRQAA